MAMFREGLAIAVILLFIGVAFAPSINSSVVKDELIEFDVEFCGLDKKHTVQLTQREADEVELLFNDIEQQLSEVETREETNEIFNDAIIELNNYGLLGDFSVDFIQKLVTGVYKYPKILEGMERLYNKNKEVFNVEENILCLVAGLTTTTIFRGPIIEGIGISLLIVSSLFLEIAYFLDSIESWILYPLYYLFLNIGIILDMPGYLILEGLGGRILNMLNIHI